VFAVQTGGAITPWQTLYFELGSNAPANTGAGGVNGGGRARGGDEGPYGPAGAGVGVARLTCAAPLAAAGLSPDLRPLVAGGGGGRWRRVSLRR
jgi:hypothetical protein